ncbi:MAG: hypothetical protein RIR26_1034 [Pseudomonadota bacterium]|jgi:hypothetical protein
MAVAPDEICVVFVACPSMENARENADDAHCQGI